MNAKKRKTLSILLVIALLVTLSPISATTSNAEESPTGGWLNHVQDIEFGVAHTDMLTETDYYYKTPYFYVVDAYKISMPRDGKLNIYFESESKSYFSNNKHNVYGIYSTDDPDTQLTSFYRPGTFVTARNVYTNSTDVSLPQGDYYVVVVHGHGYQSTCYINTPYNITFSLEESQINVSAISLNKTSLSLGVGSSETLMATVVPDNATDKSLIWESSNPSVATVSNGTVTGVSVGNATITVYSSDRVISASAQVTVGSTSAPTTTTAPSKTAAPAATSTPSVPTGTYVPTVPTAEPAGTEEPTATPIYTVWEPTEEDIELFESGQPTIKKITSKKRGFRIVVNFESGSDLDDLADTEFQYRTKKSKKWKGVNFSWKWRGLFFGLKSNTLYYVRVRANYLSENGNEYTTHWSTIKTVRTK